MESFLFTSILLFIPGLVITSFFLIENYRILIIFRLVTLAY